MKKPKTKYQIITGILDQLRDMIKEIEIKQQHIKNAIMALDSYYGRGLSDHYKRLIAKYRNELKGLKNKFYNLRIKLLLILEQW